MPWASNLWVLLNYLRFTPACAGTDLLVSSSDLAQYVLLRAPDMQSSWRILKSPGSLSKDLRIMPT